MGGPAATLAPETRSCVFRAAVTVDPSSVEGWFWLAVTRITGAGSRSDSRLPQTLSLGVREVNTRAQAWAWLASSLSKTGCHAEALGSLAEADSIGSYEPAAEYQALRSSIRRRARRAQRQTAGPLGAHDPGHGQPKVRVAIAPILVAGHAGGHIHPWPRRRCAQDRLRCGEPIETPR